MPLSVAIGAPKTLSIESSQGEIVPVAGVPVTVPAVMTGEPVLVVQARPVFLPPTIEERVPMLIEEPVRAQSAAAVGGTMTRRRISAATVTVARSGFLASPRGFVVSWRRKIIPLLSTRQTPPLPATPRLAVTSCTKRAGSRLPLAFESVNGSPKS